MIYSGVSSIIDLQNVNGDLSWGANILTTNSHSTTELSAKQDTLTAGANITISNNTIESTGGLIIQSGGTTQTLTTLNFGSHITNLSNNVLTVSRLNQYDKIPLRDAGISTIRDLEADFSGKLRWDNDVIVTNTALATTEAWVTANFLTPLNPGTVGVNIGLAASMTANSLLISVDENNDERTKFRLKDSNNIVRDITTNTAGKLLYDNVPLQNQLTNYSENADPNTYYINTDEPNGTFLSGWTGGATNNTGYQTVPVNQHINLPNLPTSGKLTFSFQLRGVGTKTDLVLTINNSQTYTGYQEVKFTGLNSTFQSNFYMDC